MIILMIILDKEIDVSIGIDKRRFAYDFNRFYVLTKTKNVLQSSI